MFFPGFGIMYILTSTEGRVKRPRGKKPEKKAPEAGAREREEREEAAREPEDAGAAEAQSDEPPTEVERVIVHVPKLLTI